MNTKLITIIIIGIVALVAVYMISEYLKESAKRAYISKLAETSSVLASQPPPNVGLFNNLISNASGLGSLLAFI